MDMRIGELAKQSGTSLATIKYYLREGLLQPGERTSINQAIYSQVHLDRLRLIRALTKVAGLPLEKVRDVINAIASDSPVPEALKATHDALTTDTDNKAIEQTLQVDSMGTLLQVIDLQGWKYRLDSSAFKSAQNAISALAAEDLLIPVARLNRYATAADAIGRIDLEEAAGSSTQHTRSVILSSVLRRPLLDALILLAQEHYAQSL